MFGMGDYPHWNHVNSLNLEQWNATRILMTRKKKFCVKKYAL
jgi:hypothetical protein